MYLTFLFFGNSLSRRLFLTILDIVICTGSLEHAPCDDFVRVHGKCATYVLNGACENIHGFSLINSRPLTTFKVSTWRHNSET